MVWHRQLTGSFTEPLTAGLQQQLHRHSLVRVAALISCSTSTYAPTCLTGADTERGSLRADQLRCRGIRARGSVGSPHDAARARRANRHARVGARRCAVCCDARPYEHRMVWSARYRLSWQCHPCRKATTAATVIPRHRPGCLLLLLPLLLLTVPFAWSELHRRQASGWSGTAGLMSSAPSTATSASCM